MEKKRLQLSTGQIIHESIVEIWNVVYNVEKI